MNTLGVNNQSVVSSFFPPQAVQEFLEGRPDRENIAKWLHGKISQYKLEIKSYCEFKEIPNLLVMFIEHSLNTLLKPLAVEFNSGPELTLGNYQFNKILFKPEEQELFNLIFLKVAMDIFKQLNAEKKIRSKTNPKHTLTPTERAGKLFFKKYFYLPARQTPKIIIPEDKNKKTTTGSETYGIYTC